MAGGTKAAPRRVTHREGPFSGRAGHKEQGSGFRRYIIRRNKHAADERLRAVVSRANVA